MAMSDTITQIRTEKGLTQEQMARDLFVTRQAISRWETGETSPSIDMGEVDLRYLFDPARTLL